MMLYISITQDEYKSLKRWTKTILENSTKEKKQISEIAEEIVDDLLDSLDIEKL